MRKYRLFSLLCAASACALGPAHAQWYVGASAGSSRASFDGDSQAEQLLDLGFEDASTSIDRSDTMARVHAGYRFHRNVAVELAYVDLGELRVRSVVLPAGTLDASVESRGADLSVLGLWPIGDRFTVFGRVGAFAARTRATYAATGSVELVDGGARQAHRSTRVLYGLGVMYQVTPRLAVRGDWAHYDKLGSDVTGGRFDIRTLSAGIVWRF